MGRGTVSRSEMVEGAVALPSSPSVTAARCHLPMACRHREELYSASLTKLSITRFGPAVSNSISSLLPSCVVTVP